MRSDREYAMKWIKKGRIFVPDGSKPWASSHAQVPVADVLEDGETIRVYFSSRDAEGRSRPGWIEVSARDPRRILREADSPLLDLGPLGAFDDCGVMPSWVVNHQGRKYLYYIGWNVRNTIPYHNSVGLALSEDGGRTFQRFSEGPLWERNTTEPYFSGTSCVLVDDNGTWRSWYLSCTEWRMVKGHPEPRYHIKYAESEDGCEWVRKGTVAVDYKSEDEAGIVKASVIKEDGFYKMWYAHRRFVDYRTDRRNSYRIGYAESSDGIGWTRLDDRAGIDVSEEGWDSQMLAYPHVIDWGGVRYLFYNGNGFGREGFGYAVLDAEGAGEGSDG